MHRLHIGDTVQNGTQRATVRWLGEIEDIPIIGLQSIDLTLPGYTDGTCPFDNNRYFRCPPEQGYYILETGLKDSYEIIKTNQTVDSDSDAEFKSPARSLSSSPNNAPISPRPIQSVSSPIVSQSQHRSDNQPPTSPSRGVLSRLAFEREQRQHPTSSIELTPRSARKYQPENYKSTSFDRTEGPEWTAQNSDDKNETMHSQQSSLTHHVPVFGHEYFLNDWTLGRVKNLLNYQISVDNQLCLNVLNDQQNIATLVDEQINGCLSLLPSLPPNDVRIELIKLYDHVEVVFPSRSIRLYACDYLLLAILCSNNNCAYIRTSNGWAYTDDENDHGESILIDEISQMIDDTNDRLQYHSEQCRHVLKNASYLYYKRVK